MTRRALAAAVGALLILAVAATAQSTTVVRLAPAQDVSLPFWCDWGYDWDERCYRDDGDRLPVGGDEDKVWRAALRFSRPVLPANASIVHAWLRVFHDGRCLGPRKTARACDERGYELAAHPILRADWFGERELDFAPEVAVAELDSATEPQWLEFDVTDLVAEWLAGRQPNLDALLKLSDAQEGYDVSGPTLPSSTFGDPAKRPHLEVAYARSPG